MQRQIPRPADPLCRGTVGILSERIGSPLESDFPLHLLEAANEWTDPQHQYRLQHPWPEKVDEQNELLANGAFPLTGTIWEFLDAHHAGNVPVFLAFIADKQVDAEDASVGFGRGVLYGAYAARGHETHKAWMQRTYEPQIRALRNFIGALAARGIDLKTYPDDADLIVAVRAFVSKFVLEQSPGSERIPFKRLDFYDIEDGDVFYGRDLLSDSVARDIDELAERDERSTAVGLTGVSGSGKSSALRAGVLYRLQQRRQRGRYHVMAVRPTDFHNHEGDPENIVPRILSGFVLSTGLRSVHGFAEALSAPRGARAAVDAISQALPPALDGEPSRLVIGLDQLEEIVDDLLDESSAPPWRPLLEFIGEAQKSGRILFVYTLETARTTQISKTPLRTFVDELFQHKVASGPEFWREIVTQPFRTAGFALDAGIRKKLLDNIGALTRDKPEAEVGALLPLVSLTLSKLYVKAKHRKARYDKHRGTSPLFAEARPKFELDPDDFHADDFDIEKAIANEASEAIVRLEIEPLEPDDLNYLLRPFVRFSGGDDDAVTLRAAVAPRFSPEHEIVDAFLKRRLVVPVDAQRCRLVHEAILRHWPPARQWLGTARGELRIENAMRERAQQWDRAGRKGNRLQATDERIGFAALLLSAYLRAWSGGSHVVPGDEVLRDYCLSLLKRSRAPSTRVGSAPVQTTTHAYLAAAYGRVDILKVFATRDIAALRAKREGDGRTLVHAAAWFHPKAVACLMEFGASPTSRTKDGWRPISSAVWGNNREAFELLLPRYKKDQLDGPDGQSLLHDCAQTNNREMAQRLIEDRRLSADVRSTWGTPLHLAAAKGHVEVAKLLLPITDVMLRDRWGRTPLHDAAAHGSGDMIDLLLSRYDPNCTVQCDEPGTFPDSSAPLRSTPLHVAARQQKSQAVKRLLDDARTNPNATDREGRTPLALSREDPEIRTDLLEDERVDPWLPIAPDGPSPLQICLSERKWRLCQRMLKRATVPEDPDAPVTGYGLFDTALENGAETKVLQALASALSGRIDHPDPKGLTPLMAAAKNRSLPAIRILTTEARADVNFRSEETGTALHVALKHRASLDVARALRAGMRGELLVEDGQGWTPLHIAAVTVDDEVGQWLLDDVGPALLQTRDRWGRRPPELCSQAWAPAAGDAAHAPSPASSGSWDRALTWAPLDDVRREAALQGLAPLGDPPKRSPRTQFDEAVLPFYPAHSVRLLRLSDPAWPPDSHAYYLVAPARHSDDPAYLHLDGTSPPIHAVNAQAPIALTPDLVCDYLRFFCFFVRGDEGPFIVAESIEQPEIPPLPEQRRTEVDRQLRPAHYWGSNPDDGAYRASATIYYGSALFFADFLISANGKIEMVTDVTVLSDLPQAANVAIV
ncbi:ankyrin repeat domain-containing protein [Aromatoleum sp.]|uniref:ankyrin repeat domain-containing protein n=1 Tax=Aromatoleum sp. TaxID=2307007 RepID=UPI002FC91691